jgi:hypothetical protein
MMKNKMVNVRCWKIQNMHDVDSLLITYPEGHMGHDLIICLSCGQIHAAEISSQMYIKPLDEQLELVHCVKCEKLLLNNSSKYPDTYLSNKGNITNYQRSNELPIDSDSIVVELPSIY